MSNVAVTDDLGAVQRVLSNLPPHLIALFPKIRAAPKHIVLAGGRSLEPALNAAGKVVTFAESEPNALPPGALLVWDPTFDEAGYETAARLRARFPGRVTTTFNLLSDAALFDAVGHLVGFHVVVKKLLRVLSGTADPSTAGGLGGLTPLSKVIPIQGRRVIEYGPLDGAMTAALLQLGAAEVTCVEIRMVNILKMLAVQHIFGWGNRLKLLAEDMHMVDGHSAGRFDLVVAHGVYYHSVSPFRFLRNLCTLGDDIFIGGMCADPERLASSLVELRDKEHVYRAQPYIDRVDNDGGGTHPLGYYFVPEDLILFMEREGYSVQTINRTQTRPGKQAGQYLWILCRPKSQGEMAA